MHKHIGMCVQIHSIIVVVSRLFMKIAEMSMFVRDIQRAII